MSVIKVEKLNKDYGNHKGVFDLSFDIERGVVFGFLGPNGAGKTTTMRHLLGFIKGDSGQCLINDRECFKNAALNMNNIGYLPGEISFFDDMTGNAFLNFMGEMRGMKKFKKKDYLIKFFDIDTSIKIKKMSKGMKQKIGLVCAFMHDPDILILDEPTSGLDPLMQNKFIDLINMEKENGKTILMSSHSIEEVEKTCDKVAIIKQGRLVAYEDVSQLVLNRRKIYRIKFHSLLEVNNFITEKINVLSHQDSVVMVEVFNDINKLIDILSNYKIVSFESVVMNLEDIFMTFYGGENND